MPSPLARARLSRGLRQADLARLVGVSRQYVSKVESQGWHPPSGRQNAFAAALGVTRAAVFPTSQRVENPPGRAGFDATLEALASESIDDDEAAR